MMKIKIFVKDSGQKNRPSKGFLKDIKKLERIFLMELNKNGHFKKVNDVTFTIALCGSQKIRTLNREFRKLDKKTDVLSFSLYENLRPDQLDNGTQEYFSPEVCLGDIFICKEVALKQSLNFNITYEEELLHLIVHGFLHLLGYDHEISLIEEKIMEKKEALLLKNFGKL